MNEQNIFESFIIKWFLTAALALVIFALICLCSCNTQKHIVKSESKIDTSYSAQSKTETQTKVDSSSYHTSNIDFTDSSITLIKDDYTETNTKYYAVDSATGNSILIKSETKKSGTKTKKNNNNIKSNQFDTGIKAASTEITTKEDKNVNQAGKSEIKQSDKTKVSESAFKVPALAWIVGGFLLIGIVLYFTYKAFKSARGAK